MIRKLDDKFFQLTSGSSLASPPLKKGDLGGFSNGYIKSPLTPLYERGVMADFSPGKKYHAIYET
jgi:hypothetical protein